MCVGPRPRCVWEWADRCGRIRDDWPEDFEKYKKERVEGQSNGKGQLPIAGEFFHKLVTLTDLDMAYQDLGKSLNNHRDLELAVVELGKKKDGAHHTHTHYTCN